MNLPMQNIEKQVRIASFHSVRLGTLAIEFDEVGIVNLLYSKPSRAQSNDEVGKIALGASQADGANIPAMTIEYKAPHKLSQDEIVTGLASEIQPERDVIK